MFELENKRVAAALAEFLLRYRQMTRDERVLYIAALRRLVEPRRRFAATAASISTCNVVEFPHRGHRSRRY